MPNPGSTHVSQALTQVSLGYPTEPFVARRVFPETTSPKLSAKVYTIDSAREMARVVDELRAPGSPAIRRDFTFSKSTVEIPDHAARQPVTLEDEANADEVIKDEIGSVQNLTEWLLLQEEKRLAAFLFNATTFSGHTNTDAHKFDQATGYTDPAEIIRASATVVSGQIGRRANCVLVGQAVHDAIADNVAIKDRLKYTSGKSVTPEMLRELFQVDDYIVGQASYNSAAEGAAATMARVWATEYMLVFYRPPVPARKTPAVGYTILPENIGVRGVLVEREQLRDGALARQVIVHRYYHQHLMTAAAGELHTNCVGAS